MPCLSISVFTTISRLGTICNYFLSSIYGGIDKAEWFVNSRRGMTLLRQEASCFCEAKVSPVALSAIPVTVNWPSDKRYLCVRINYQAGSFSRQSKSRYDRRLSFRKTGTYNSTNQNLQKIRAYPPYKTNTPLFFIKFVDFYSFILFTIN